MEKKLVEQVELQSNANQADWATLNDNELAAVGGGCAESTPY